MRKLVFGVLVAALGSSAVAISAQKARPQPTPMYVWEVGLPSDNESMIGDAAHGSAETGWIYRDAEAVADVRYFLRTYSNVKSKTQTYTPVFDVLLYPGANLGLNVGDPVAPSSEPPPSGFGLWPDTLPLFDFLNTVPQPAEGYNNLHLQVTGPTASTLAGADLTTMDVGGSLSAPFVLWVNGQSGFERDCSESERHNARIGSGDGVLTRTGPDTWLFTVDTDFSSADPQGAPPYLGDTLSQNHCIQEGGRWWTQQLYWADGHMRFSVEFRRYVVK